MKINLKNIKSYLEGNYKYYKDKLIGTKPYIKEQYLYRINKCKYDCIPNDACKYCGCPPKKKLFVEHSCNRGERFPNMMDKKDWEKYKEKYNIGIDKY